MTLSKTKAGLVVGVLAALVHLAWAICVMTGVAQTVLDWIYKLHFLNNPFQIQTFELGFAGILILGTFVVGFVAGWLLALVLNMAKKEEEV